MQEALVLSREGHQLAIDGTGLARGHLGTIDIDLAVVIVRELEIELGLQVGCRQVYYAADVDVAILLGPTGAYALAARSESTTAVAP